MDELNRRISEIYNPKNDIWGYPQIWRGISFYPLKIKDTKALKLYFEIFQYPKYSKWFVDEKLVIKSSYLKYLLFFIQQIYEINKEIKNPTGREIRGNLIEFLKIVTQSDNIKIEDKRVLTDEQRLNYGKMPLDYRDIIRQSVFIIYIDDIEFSEYDFDIIREIILRQNGLSTKYIEEYNPELETVLQYENSKFQNLNLEDEIILFSVLMGIGVNDIENYTLYQFRRSMERLLAVHNYNLFKPLEVSGQIKSKNGSELIKHYLLGRKDESRYSNILIDKTEFSGLVPDNSSDNKLGEAIGEKMEQLRNIGR